MSGVGHTLMNTMFAAVWQNESIPKAGLNDVNTQAFCITSTCAAEIDGSPDSRHWLWPEQDVHVL